MTLEDYIAENCEAIDEVIRFIAGPETPIDDEERELWIMNDEGLYNMAQEAGVDI